MLFLSMHIIHLLTVILWIGGLAFVTGIVLPMAIKTPDPLQKVLTFQRVEHRFAPIAKWYNIITGISGFFMVYLMGWHKLYFTKAGIALTFMTGIWLFWFIMLVGLEPIVIRKMLEKMAREGDKMDIDGIFRKVKKLHWFMVAISLAAAAAGALVAHGPASLY
ncbi:MAG: hypothetical protein HYS21_00450 [Deltaproteobacteria bacterium]|nr:hypothetical protein [Deltaproteobacteria bacterium]